MDNNKYCGRFFGYAECGVNCGETWGVVKITRPKESTIGPAARHVHPSLDLSFDQRPYAPTLSARFQADSALLTASELESVRFALGSKKGPTDHRSANPSLSMSALSDLSAGTADAAQAGPSSTSTSSAPRPTNDLQNGTSRAKTETATDDEVALVTADQAHLAEAKKRHEADLKKYQYEPPRAERVQDE
jgi:hypothetical protein